MTELNALNVKLTGDASGLTGAVNTASQSLGRLDASVAKSEQSAVRMSSTFGRMGQSIKNVDSRQLSWQLSQIAQQGSVTGQWAQAFAVQLGDIIPLVGGTGLLATGIGALAMVGLPLLAGAFLNSGEAAKTFSERADEARSAINDLKAITDLYSGESMGKLIERYGQLDTALAAHIQRMREVAEATALANTQAMIDQVVADLGGLNGIYNGLADTFGLLEEEAIYLGNQLRRAMSEDEPKKQIVALEAVLRQMESITGGYDQMNAAQQKVYDNIVQSVDQLRILTATQPGEGWLSAAISGAQNLANTLWDAVSAKAALSNDGAPSLGDDERGSQRGVRASGGAFRSQQAQRDRMRGVNAGAGGGGGGGAAENPIQAELEALQEGLMSAEQLQMESYTRQQEVLNEALNQRLITQQEYQALMEAATSQHYKTMADSSNNGATQILGALGSLFEGNKKVGAGIALVNTMIGASEELKKGTFGIASAIRVIAQGMSFVRAIKSASSSGGGGAGAAGATAAPPQQNVQTLNFNVQNDQFGIGANLIRQIASQLNEAQRNGSTLIRATVV